MRNILLVANKKYVIQLFVMLASLFSNNKYPLNVYLLSSDFDNGLFDLAQKYCEQWEDKRLIPVSLSSSDLNGLPISDRFPVEIYYKLLGVDILPKEESRVLVMDIDMIVKQDLSQVFELSVDNYALAACRDIYGYVYGEEKNNIARLTLSDKQVYFNAGFMYYNLDYLRNDGGAKYIIEQAYKHDNLLKWPEQDLLNILYGDNFLELDWHSYNCTPIMYILNKAEVDRGCIMPLSQEELNKMSNFDGYMDYTRAIYDQAGVIHYIGETKPWNNMRPSAPTFEVFDKAYIDYLQIANEMLQKCEMS